MIVNVSIDLSLNNIWQCWFKFKQGKKRTKELENFSYYLEDNLGRLYVDIKERNYIHGGYSYFVVRDNKRRDIAVANIRDRVAHRLVYEFLVQNYDHTFIYDLWSCRQGKGLAGAIERAQKFLKKYPDSFVWRADVVKFFDNVQHDLLLEIISQRIKDEKAFWMIKKIIESYFYGEKERKARGIPIGNLTSQIFANIYLNELDRFVKHTLKPRFYLRYGDDFIMIARTKAELLNLREQAVIFLKDSLGLAINNRNDIVLPVRRGIYFLGVDIYATGLRLKNKTWQKARRELNQQNVFSYHGLIKKYAIKKLLYFNWLITKMYD